MAMTSLFGPTPAQIEEARRLQSRQEIAQEAQPFGVFAPLYAASRNLSRTAGQSLVSGLFPEAQDPALREAQAVEQIRQKYIGQNMTDPSVLQQMAVELGPVAPMAALRLAQTAKQLMPSTESSAFAKIDPKDYTTESVKAFAQTGDYGSLVARDKPNARYRELSKAEIAARGLNPNMSYQLEEGTNKVTQLGQGPALVINAPLVGAEGAYAKGVGEDRAKTDVGQFASAQAAIENLPKINETLNELKTGEAFTGAFAELQKNIQKVQAKFAEDRKAGKRVSDTEYLDALLGSEVFPLIGALGIGARGLDTPAEREFLRQVMTGTVNLERDTLVRLTEQRKRIAEKAINRFNKRVDDGEMDDFFKYRGGQPRKFEIPKFEPPTPAPSAAPQQSGGWSIKKVQ
jgi:hypothetical protein